MGSIFEKGKFKILLLTILKNNGNYDLYDKLSKCTIELKNFGDPYQSRNMRCPWNSEGLDVQIYASIDNMSAFSETDKSTIRDNSVALFPEGYVIGNVNILPTLDEDIKVEIPKTTSGMCHLKVA